MPNLKYELNEMRLGFKELFKDIAVTLKQAGEALYDTIHWYYIDHQAKNFMDEIREIPTRPWVEDDDYLYFPLKCRITKEEVLLAVEHVHMICIAYGNANPATQTWIRHHKLYKIIEICMQYMEKFKEDTGYDPVISKATR